MTLYHHHEPAGTCGICSEFAFAHATFWLPAADIMAQHAHWQTCEVARARLAQAHAQVALPGLYASLLVRLALVLSPVEGLVGVATARSMEVVIPELELQEAV